MVDIVQTDSTDELPSDVLDAYAFYGALIDKGIDRAGARRATCKHFPRCEEALLPLWDMDDRLRKPAETPQCDDSECVSQAPSPSAIPTPQGFESICKIGEGGQAEVWLARDLQLDRFVAIKVIKGALRESQRTQQRFRREVEITGKLEHPSIVPVYETGSDTASESDQPFYVMRLFINRHLLRAITALHERRDCAANQRLLEALFAFHCSATVASRRRLLDELQSFAWDESAARDVELKDSIDKFLADVRTGSGGSLHDAIEAHYAAGRPALGFRDLLGRFVDVCHATAYAHSRGVIHRDLKPRNVMLGEFGETLVVDWGLAKVVGREAERRRLDSGGTVELIPDGTDDDSKTRDGTVTGTVQYMSPEQAWGRIDELRPASDIYSLGAILFNILTGKPPRADATLDAARQGRFDIPSQVQTQVPMALEKICLKCLSKDPLDRYATAEELANDVRNWLADEPVTVWRDPVWTRIRRWVKKHRTLVGSLTAAMVVAGITLLITIPPLLATGEKLNLVEKENERLLTAEAERDRERIVEKERSRQISLINKINTQESRGTLLLLCGDPAAALDEYEETLKEAWFVWANAPGNAELGQALMRLLRSQACACERLGRFDHACECYRREIDICLGILAGGPDPAAASAVERATNLLFSAESQSLLEWCVFEEMAQPCAEMGLVATNGIDGVDFMMLTLNISSTLARHASSLSAVGNVDSHEDAIHLQYLAHAYRSLGQLEAHRGALAAAHEAFALSVFVDAVLPSMNAHVYGGAPPARSELPVKDDHAPAAAAFVE